MSGTNVLAKKGYTSGIPLLYRYGLTCLRDALPLSHAAVDNRAVPVTRLTMLIASRRLIF